MEKSELCALLWFLEFTLSKARDEKQIREMESSVKEVLQEESLGALKSCIVLPGSSQSFHLK